MYLITGFPTKVDSPTCLVSHAKQPATNVVLSAPGGEVPMQAEESVLYNILGFVFGEPGADQIP